MQRNGFHIRLVSRYYIWVRVDYGLECKNFGKTYNFQVESPRRVENIRKGDSGGPLVCDINGTLTLMGLVSKGRQCNKEGYPGIYTNIQAFRTWLDESKSLYSIFSYGRSVRLKYKKKWSFPTVRGLVTVTLYPYSFSNFIFREGIYLVRMGCMQ